MLSGVSEPKRGTDPAGDFAEIWDSERRNASYLRVVTGGLLVLLLALSTGWCRSASRTLQPVFVRVDEIGRAEALDYAALTWQNDPLHPVHQVLPAPVRHRPLLAAVRDGRGALAALAGVPGTQPGRRVRGSPPAGDRGILGRGDPRGARCGESRAAHPGAPGGAPRGDRRLRPSCAG